MVKWLLKCGARPVIRWLLKDSSKLITVIDDRRVDNPDNLLFLECKVREEFEGNLDSSDARMFVRLITLNLIYTLLLLVFALVFGLDWEGRELLSVPYLIFTLFALAGHKSLIDDSFSEDNRTLRFMGSLSQIAVQLSLLLLVMWMSKGISLLLFPFALMLALYVAVKVSGSSDIDSILRQDLSMDQTSAFIKSLRGCYTTSAMRRIMDLTMDGESFSYAKLIDLQNRTPGESDNPTGGYVEKKDSVR